MKPQVLFLVALGLVIPALESWAGSSGPEGDPSCQVDRLIPGNHAVPLRGTAAAEALNVFLDETGFVADIASDLDVTLRLEKGSVRKFFRLHLSQVIHGTIFSNDVIACLFLDPNAGIAAGAGAQGANFAAVNAFVQNILTMFGLEPTRKLVILKNSITKGEEETHNRLIPQTGTVTPSGFVADVRGASLADITVYAVVCNQIDQASRVCR